MIKGRSSFTEYPGAGQVAKWMKHAKFIKCTLKLNR